MSLFKIVSAIILPTQDNDSPLAIYLAEDGSIKNGELCTSDAKEWSNCFRPQHLYIVSDDIIKKDEWFLNLKSKAISQYDGFKLLLFKEDKKIIVTTNTALKIATYYGMDEDIPQPSRQFLNRFIKEYNSSSIDPSSSVTIDVLVEYEECCDSTTSMGLSVIEKPKKNLEDNTVLVKCLKEDWIDDIRRLCALLYFSNSREVDFNNQEELNNWIDKNL